MAAMRVAVVDVGSNTVRLLVASTGNGRGQFDIVLSKRRHLGLAADVERSGLISDEKLARAAALTRRYIAAARGCGAASTEVVVTAPGRQSANAGELRRALTEASGAPVRQLSAEEEGRLAYCGAVATCRTVRESVAVCDVGGGSTQLMVGTGQGPSWLRSLDIGSLRLTERYVDDDPPGPPDLAALEREVERAFEGLTAPLPIEALATGGTARALRRLVGRRLGEERFGEALRLLTRQSSREVAERYALPPERARTLAAGAIVLREAHRRLGVELAVARGGMREGVLLELFAAAEAAA
jgi:exopolyphosphatase / guanosine-5'-triphosphate,3'-diphosphate pyrophosphatase